MYRVILTGLREDVMRPDAVKNLAALFKTTPEQVEKLLATPGCIVKKGITEEVSSKYRAAIEAAGGACRVEQEVPPVQTLDVDLPIPTLSQVIMKSDQKSVEGSVNNQNSTNGQMSLGQFLISRRIFFLCGILILGGLGVLIVKHETTPATPLGTYRYGSEDDSTIFGEIYYPDGARIRMMYVRSNNANGKLMLFQVVVGMCRPNGAQLDCRETGDADTVTAILKGRPDISRDDFKPRNVETSDLIKMEPDGSFVTMRVKAVVDGQPRPQSIENKWEDTKHLPIHNRDQTETESKIRQSIPAQFFQ